MSVSKLVDGQGRVLRPGATVRDNGYEFARLGNPVGDGRRLINLDITRTTRNFQQVPSNPSNVLVAGTDPNTSTTKGYNGGFYGVFHGSMNPLKGISRVLGGYVSWNWLVLVWQASVDFPGKMKVVAIEAATVTGTTPEPSDSFGPVSLYDIAGDFQHSVVSTFVGDAFVQGTPTNAAYKIWLADNLPNAFPTAGRAYNVYARDITGEVGEKARRTSITAEVANAQAYGLRWVDQDANRSKDGKQFTFQP